MKLGLNLGYSGRKLKIPIEMIQEAERMGFDSVWTAEAYGSDALTPLAWIGAQTERIKLATGIVQMSARTPAATAMGAITIDQLCEGRMILGLGASGPQVVEGWYGQPYRRPLARTREYIDVMKQVFRREAPVMLDGEQISIPYNGPNSTGMGKPLKSILHGRADLPIYLGAEGPKNISLAAEIADGWLAMLLSPRHFNDVYRPFLESGFERAGNGKGYDNFDVACYVPVTMGDDLDACRDSMRPYLALYIGGMGSKKKNFHKDVVVRYGYGEVADQIQDLYLAGKKAEAQAAIPTQLIDDVCLVGPKEHIRDQLAVWKECKGITTMLLSANGYQADGGMKTIETIAELIWA
ncbi:MAG: LLM class F420-dependent oxidoreductase [Candidatus Promineifilaceae bacterium]